MLSPKPRSPSKSAQKQALIHKTATSLFNSRGIGRVTLAVVAKESGMSRATLYHYVQSREELVFQCYLRSIALASARLHALADLNPLEKITRYIQSSLSERADDEAIIADTGMLSADNSEKLEIALHSHYKDIEQILIRGIELGSIRSLNTQVISRIIPNMLSFIRQSPRWTKETQSKKRLEGILEIAKFGVASERVRTIRIAENVDIFSRLKVPGFEKNSLAETRKEQLLMTGSWLFNRRGVENISLDDVAEVLNVTRGGVYHYFIDKPQFISECIDRGLDIYDSTMSYAETFKGNGFEKSMVGLQLNTRAQVGSLQPFLPWNRLDIIHETQREKIITKMQALLKRSDNIAEIGFKDNSRRPNDPIIASLMGAGAFLTIPKWIDDISETDTPIITDVVVDFIANGLAPI
jgi:AcrR family transcriptional regulator